jgi:Protein of unknown function (DUF2637)
MNVPFSAPRRNWPSLLLNLAVLIVVLAMAAATFVLSYSGVHAIVLQAGVSPRLARIYPGLFDAVFVIACVAAVMLWNARWWALLYAWLVIILMLVVVAAADVVYAMNITLRHRTIEGVVAAAPWVLLLLGFTLMLTIFRQSRVQRARATASAEPAYLAPGLAELPEAAPEQETHALPVGVWLPQDEPEPYDVHGPDDVHAQEDVPAPDDEDVPQHEDGPEDETAQPAEPAAEVGVHAPEPDTTDVAVAQETDADPDSRAAGADVDAAGDASPAEPVAEKPVMAAAADEAPSWEPEPAAPEPAAEPVAAGNGGSAPAYAAYQEAAAPATPYNYWDSGADSGYHEPDRVPTLPGEVIDDDAPPFATAPFAAVPRFNRVRSSPMPPEGDDEDQ